MKTKEALVAKLSANINVKNRPDNLMQVGEFLNQLIKMFDGNKKLTAQSLGLSLDMVNKFLSVFKVSTDVQKLVEYRKINSIFAVHALKSLKGKDQKLVATEIANNKFSSQEVRALIPLRNTFPDEPILRLVEVIRNTKDSKHYVNHFPYPGKEGVQAIEQRIKMVVGDEPFSLKSDGNIGVFKITKSGNKKMRADAARLKMGFHGYLLRVFGSGEMM